MKILGLGVALLLIFCAGLGVTLAAMRGQRRLNLLEVCALSWFLGTGVISLLLWCGGFFLSGALLQGGVTLLAVGLGTFGLLAAKKEQMRVSIPFPRNAVEWILVTIIALQFAMVLYLSFSFGLGWDGLLNFEIKARFSFFNHGVLPAAYFSDAARDFSHQAHPPWIPFTELWLYLWMGEAHQFWVKTLFAPFYFAGSILLATLASRLTSSRWIGLLTVALLFFVPSLTMMPGGVVVGYADYPMSVLYLAAIGYLLRATETKGSCSWRIYALSLALLPWAKREGSILWMIGALCGILVIWKTRRSWLSALWLLPGPVITLAWKAFYSAMGKTEGSEFLPMTLATLKTNWPRMEVIGQGLLRHMMDTTEWSILWLVVLLAFGSLFWRQRDQRLLLLFIAVAGPIFLYSSIYLFSGWPDLTVHIELSLARLLLHVVPVVCLVIALALKPPKPRLEPLATVAPVHNRRLASAR